MTDYSEVSYIFDFQRVPDFFVQWNQAFKTAEMSGSGNKFQLVIASHCPSNIGQCLTSGGALDTSTVTIPQIDGSDCIADCSLTWNTSEETIRLSADTSLNLSDNRIDVKAIFLRHKSTGYVMGYSIANNSFTVTNEIIFDKDTLFWSIRDE